jgi:hypothetical protein
MAEETPVEEAAAPEKKSKVKTIGVYVIVLAVGLFAGKTFLGGGGGSSTTIQVVAPTTTPLNLLDATTVKLDPILANLSDGGVAKLTLAVTIDPHHAPGGGGDGHGGGAAVDPAEMALKLSPLSDVALDYLTTKTLADVSADTFRSTFRTFLEDEASVMFNHAVARISITELVFQ